MENKKNQTMDLNEMDKVSGGSAQDVSQGDLDILTPKNADEIFKPKKDDNKIHSPKLGGDDPTIIGDPTIRWENK